MMRVTWRTPGYIIRRSELKREKMRIRAGKRAWNFERRSGKGKGAIARNV
jgi:hypothetical protein